VISTTSKAQIENQSNDSLTSMEIPSCTQCGGNGYMKTTPNCYHTCLSCLGRGFTPLEN